MDWDGVIRNWPISTGSTPVYLYSACTGTMIVQTGPVTTNLLDGPPLLPAVLHEREKRRQLLRNTRGPRASRWS